METIYMNYQILFPGGKKKKSKYRQLKFLPSMLNVNYKYASVLSESSEIN